MRDEEIEIEEVKFQQKEQSVGFTSCDRQQSEKFDKKQHDEKY